MDKTTMQLGQTVFVRRSADRPMRAYGQGTVTAVTPTHVHVEVNGKDLLCTPQELTLPFSTWEDLLDAIAAGERISYHAPLDLYAQRIEVPRVYKNGKIRVTVAHVTFTADHTHLDRFRRSARHECLTQA